MDSGMEVIWQPVGERALRKLGLGTECAVICRLASSLASAMRHLRRCHTFVQVSSLTAAQCRAAILVPSSWRMHHGEVHASSSYRRLVLDSFHEIPRQHARGHYRAGPCRLKSAPEAMLDPRVQRLALEIDRRGAFGRRVQARSAANFAQLSAS